MNTEVLETANDVDELKPQQQFGERFRLAREVANLSILDVSESLKLPEETIAALESSRVDLLPPRTFTQGYIRNYAHLLKLSEDDILEILGQFSAEKTTRLAARSSLPKQAHSGETKIKLLTYSLILVGVFTMIFWWFQSVSEVVESGSTEMEIPPILEDSLPEKYMPSTDIVVEEVKDELVDDVPPVINVEVAVVSTKSAVKEIEIIKEKNDLPAAIETTDNVVRIDAQKKISGEMAEFTATDGDDILILGTVSESWAEVQDANAAQLVFELLKKGGYYRVKGRAPFKIFLGNAPSVSLQMNGKPVDVIKYLRSDNLAHVYIDNRGEVSSAGRRDSTDE